ncbi:hypothetical protein [Ruminococcus sp. FC2018]|uniref:hypothetical protein n=1 Tax=Ruminococcus sp. FC2018 TaxID=1410617 RepID=UPI00048DD36B|nr:hypothetical protein [Ruminococcus sp. FC2018]
MGNYIRTSKHPKSIRAIQLLSYLALLTILATVVSFIYFSLNNSGNRDSYIFFFITFFIILSGSLNSAIGISLPNSGKFEYFRPALFSFAICSFVGVINGIKELSSHESDFSDRSLALFYTVFFLICLFSDIFILHFFADKMSRKIAVCSCIVQMLAIMLHIGIIVYSLVDRRKIFPNYTTKQMTMYFMCNVIMLIAVVTTLLVVLIKPSLYGKKSTDEK